MFVGIDLGTSGVKVALIDNEGRLVASETSALTVQQPKPLWSEQDPDSWWTATKNAIHSLSKQQNLSAIQGISFSGQMHGATLLDESNKPLRPCILWNDSRSFAECTELDKDQPDFRRQTGNLIMPGFTAPKIAWVRKHEPDIYAKLKKVLLPKDYLRFKLTGEFYSDMSDAAGTLWLDVSKRIWSESLLNATGLNLSHMPSVVEGNQQTGSVSQQVAEELGIPTVPVYAGAGDNAAGAIGSGIIESGQAMLSLGTSGVCFLASDKFYSQPGSAVHSFCHALPERWHLMSVMLSAASCLDWMCKLVGETNIGDLLKRVEDVVDVGVARHAPIFLPYLSGERTPHNNPNAKGVFFGLTHRHDKVHLVYSVLEGVSFGLRQGMEKLMETGAKMDDPIRLIGGGARSVFWRQMLADICGRQMAFCEGGDVGPALGAARLAQLGKQGIENLAGICPTPTIVDLHEANASRVDLYEPRYAKFKLLYSANENLF